MNQLNLLVKLNSKIKNNISIAYTKDTSNTEKALEVSIPIEFKMF